MSKILLLHDPRELAALVSREVDEPDAAGPRKKGLMIRVPPRARLAGHSRKFVKLEGREFPDPAASEK